VAVAVACFSPTTVTFSQFTTKISAYTKNIRSSERNSVVGGRTG